MTVPDTHNLACTAVERLLAERPEIFNLAPAEARVAAIVAAVPEEHRATVASIFAAVGVA